MKIKGKNKINDNDVDDKLDLILKEKKYHI